MTAPKKPIIRYFYTKRMPADKAWALIEKVKSDFKVVKDRSGDDHRLNEFSTKLPFAMFPEADIAIRGLSSVEGDLPPLWAGKKDIASFTEQLFQCFSNAKKIQISADTAVKGLKGRVYVSIFQRGDEFHLEFNYDRSDIEPGPEYNIALRKYIEIAELPIVLKDTETGFNVESSMRVSNYVSVATGKETFTGIKCRYDKTQLVDCAEVFARVLNHSKVSTKGLSYHIEFDKPGQGDRLISGTANVNAALKRFNALKPMPPSATICLWWTLNRHQDYQNVENVTKLLKADQQGVALFEFTCRKKPVFLDIEFKIKGPWRLQFTFHENLSDDEASKALGTKVSWT